PDVARRRQPRVRHPPSESQTRARVGGRDDVAQRCAAVRDEVHPEGGAYWRRETCRVFEPRDRSRLERDLATPIGRAVVRRTRAVRDALRETSKRWRTSDAQRDRKRVRALGREPLSALTQVEPAGVGARSRGGAAGRRDERSVDVLTDL